MGWKRNALEAAVALASRFAPRMAIPADPRSIFVLRNNGIGDVLLTTPLLAALRRRFPRARIAIGVGHWATDVLAGNPDIDAVLTVNAPWGNHLVQPQNLGAVVRYLASEEARALTRERFDLGIDVMGSCQGSLLLMRAGIPCRLGVRGYAGGHSAAQASIDYDPRQHVAAAALRFARLLGCTEPIEPRPRLFLDPPPEPHRAIVLAPGGGYAAKCWPIACYVSLAKMLAPRRIIVVGDAADRPLGAALRCAGSHVEDRTGTLSLRETFRIIAGAAVVICNSSMAMHAAAAFRLPCIVALGEEFTSATSHARLWAHPETRVLGREPDRDRIARPEDVFDILTQDRLLAP